MTESIALAQTLEHEEARHERDGRRRQLVSSAFRALGINPRDVPETSRFHRADCWIGQATIEVCGQSVVKSVYREAPSLERLRPHITCPECLRLFAEDDARADEEDGFNELTARLDEERRGGK